MLKSTATIAAFLLSTAGIAQDAPPSPPRSGGMPSVEQIFAFMDANKDGFIAKDEAQGPMAQHFVHIDADKDDKISAEELKAAMAAMRPPEPEQGEPESDSE
jgi:Ca2+-binding EF-hand superfamily protein